MTLPVELEFTNSIPQADECWYTTFQVHRDSKAAQSNHEYLEILTESWYSVAWANPGLGHVRIGKPVNWLPARLGLTGFPILQDAQALHCRNGKLWQQHPPVRDTGNRPPWGLVVIVVGPGPRAPHSRYICAPRKYVKLFPGMCRLCGCRP